jgi:hypothetical protein
MRMTRPIGPSRIAQPWMACAESIWGPYPGLARDYKYLIVQINIRKPRFGLSQRFRDRFPVFIGVAR